MARDSRIDTIRGFAMVTIIINHFSFLSAELGMTGPQIPTTTTFSVSSAAEIFVALSGYMVGMVYWDDLEYYWDDLEYYQDFEEEEQFLAE